MYPLAQNTLGDTAATANSTLFTEAGLALEPTDPQVRMCEDESHVAGKASVWRALTVVARQNPTAQTLAPEWATPRRTLSPAPRAPRALAADPPPDLRSQTSA